MNRNCVCKMAELEARYRYVHIMMSQYVILWGRYNVKNKWDRIQKSPRLKQPHDKAKQFYTVVLAGAAQIRHDALLSVQPQ